MELRPHSSSYKHNPFSTKSYVLGTKSRTGIKILEKMGRGEFCCARCFFPATKVKAGIDLKNKKRPVGFRPTKPRANVIDRYTAMQ